MNGAHTLVETFLKNNVDTCFANPGTSEMHFVAALDAQTDMRCVLCLFEGGASGAADGYYRMKQDVAATLLHLGPGFGNAFANLHNARKAGSGIVNVVGDHASYHLPYESPLKGDIDGVSGAVSHWTRRAPDAGSVAVDGAAAISAARANNGQIATLILPANTAWDPASASVAAPAPPALHRPRDADIDAAAARLRAPGAALMVGGAALWGEGLARAGRIAAATGAILVTDTLVGRVGRGAGTPMARMLPYAVEAKVAAMSDITSLTLIGTERPVTFFAYPGKPSLPEPRDAAIMPLCAPDMDIAWTLDALAQATGAAKAAPKQQALTLPDLPQGGAIDLTKIGDVLAALMPEGAILCNEGVTAAFHIMPQLTGARPHDMLGVSGGAIGWSLPGAVGAAIACPDRRVIVFVGDGSAMYNIQALWTMARESLDITVIVVANRGYQILRDELVNVGVERYGANAQAMFDVDNPLLDWAGLARGHGVPSHRAEGIDGFTKALGQSLAEPGPALIEVVCPD
ncbi:MAG: acetolactate synthase large subunit [Pseudomonadota bacterium]